MPQFKLPWLLVKGVIDSKRFLVSQWGVLGLFHMVFGMLVPRLLSDEVRNDNWEAWGTFPRAAFSAFQLMTFDSWASLTQDIRHRSLLCWLLIFWFIGICSLVLLNVGTAIVVESTFTAALKDVDMVRKHKEAQQQKQVDTLYAMFKELDEDGSGNLGINEFTDVLDDPLFIIRIQTLEIQIEELPDVFKILDDGDGEVSMQEFIAGMIKITAPIGAKDTFSCYNRMKAYEKLLRRTGEINCHKRTMPHVGSAIRQARAARLKIQDKCDQIRTTLQQLQEMQFSAMLDITAEFRPGCPDLPTMDSFLNPTDTAEKFKGKVHPEELKYHVDGVAPFLRTK
jgi:hypothetical protein